MVSLNLLGRWRCQQLPYGILLAPEAIAKANTPLPLTAKIEELYRMAVSTASET
jgi:hypothetical protein